MSQNFAPLGKKLGVLFYFFEIGFRRANSSRFQGATFNKCAEVVVGAGAEWVALDVEREEVKVLRDAWWDTDFVFAFRETKRAASVRFRVRVRPNVVMNFPFRFLGVTVLCDNET
jgi:hypothetical protein